MRHAESGARAAGARSSRELGDVLEDAAGWQAQLRERIAALSWDRIAKERQRPRRTRASRRYLMVQSSRGRPTGERGRSSER